MNTGWVSCKYREFTCLLLERVAGSLFQVSVSRPCECVRGGGDVDALVRPTTWLLHPCRSPPLRGQYLFTCHLPEKMSLPRPYEPALHPAPHPVSVIPPSSSPSTADHCPDRTPLPDAPKLPALRRNPVCLVARYGFPSHKLPEFWYTTTVFSRSLELRFLKRKFSE